MSLILLHITSLIYIILLAIFYFKQKRLSNIENKIYKYLLLSNIFGLLIEFGCFAAVPNIDKIPIFTFFITRALLIYYLYFISMYTIYVFVISNKKEKESITETNLFFKKVSKYCFAVFFIASVIISFLPMEYYYDGTYTYTYGTAVQFLQLIFIVVMGIWIFVLLRNYKNIKVKKYIPIIIFVVLAGIGGLVQTFYPYILLTTPIETLIIFLMYFTIENPDKKILDEVHKAKEISDNANEEKAMFLYNMTNDIRHATKEVDNIANEILYETENKKVDIEKVKDYARKLKNSAARFNTMTNEILDISQVDSANIRVYNEKYNVKLIIKEFVGIYKKKCIEKNLDFRTSIASDIPDYLYGDSVGLKNVLSIILDNSIKYTNDGYIEFSVNTIMRRDVCRLIISIEDTGSGIKAENLEKIFSKKEEDTEEDRHNLDNNLYNAKRLITLMGGTIIPTSVYDKGTTIKIVLDQKVVSDTDNEITKYEEVYDKKKILLVDDNISSTKIVSKLLEDSNIELESVSLGSECLDKIRNKEKYDLILLDEDMKPLDGITVMKKLKSIRSFNTNVVLLTRNNDYEYNDDYLKYGFSDYILKPIDKDKFLEKIDKCLR